MLQSTLFQDKISAKIKWWPAGWLQTSKELLTHMNVTCTFRRFQQHLVPRCSNTHETRCVLCSPTLAWDWFLVRHSESPRGLWVPRREGRAAPWSRLDARAGFSSFTAWQLQLWQRTSVRRQPSARSPTVTRGYFRPPVKRSPLLGSVVSMFWIGDL